MYSEERGNPSKGTSRSMEFKADGNRLGWRAGDQVGENDIDHQLVGVDADVANWAAHRPLGQVHHRAVPIETLRVLAPVATDRDLRWEVVRGQKGGGLASG